MTSLLQKRQCCSAVPAAQRSENCSATSVFACGMLQAWGLEGSGLGLADSPRLRYYHRANLGGHSAIYPAIPEKRRCDRYSSYLSGWATKASHVSKQNAMRGSISKGLLRCFNNSLHGAVPDAIGLTRSWPERTKMGSRPRFWHTHPKNPSQQIKSGQVRPRQGTEICNFGAPSPLEALHNIFCVSPGSLCNLVRQAP